MTMQYTSQAYERGAKEEVNLMHCFVRESLTAQRSLRSPPALYAYLTRLGDSCCPFPKAGCSSRPASGFSISTASPGSNEIRTGLGCDLHIEKELLLLELTVPLGVLVWLVLF